jgi:hypothetical protein
MTIGDSLLCLDFQNGGVTISHTYLNNGAPMDVTHCWDNDGRVSFTNQFRTKFTSFKNFH